MEATSVTGPAKGLLGFGSWLQSPEGLTKSLSVTLATYVRDEDTGRANGFVDAARAAGIEIHLIRERFRYDPAVIPQLRGLIAAVKPDVIESHSNKSHLLIRSLAAARRNRLWVALHHGDTHTNLRQRAYNQLDRLSLRWADRVITVCQAFVPLLVSRGVNPDRIRVLHNGASAVRRVPEAERARLRDELGIGTSEAVILIVGRLSREKNQAGLIEALARLPPIAREWKLVLLGTGPDLPELKRLTDTLGLAKRVLFAGFRADVAPFYAIADVLAIPSLSEGSSYVLLEAMAAGLPIVATRVGGNPEIALHEETALLVPSADATSLAGAIARVLSDQAFAARLARAGQERAMAEFSISRYMERLSSIYTEALGASV